MFETKNTRSITIPSNKTTQTIKRRTANRNNQLCKIYQGIENIDSLLKCHSKDKTIFDNTNIIYKNYKIYKNKSIPKVYLGIQNAHQSCLGHKKTVPRDMGWLWKAQTTGKSILYKGYKPGAILKSVLQAITEHNKNNNNSSRSSKDLIHHRIKNSKNTEKLYTIKSNSQKNCLELEQKNGNCLFILNPSKEQRKLKKMKSLDIPMKVDISKSDDISFGSHPSAVSSREIANFQYTNSSFGTIFTKIQKHLPKISRETQCTKQGKMKNVRCKRMKKIKVAF